MPPSSSTLLILSASDVDRITSKFSPEDLMSLMAHAFKVASLETTAENRATPAHDATCTPHRTSIPSKNHSVLFMSARIAPLSDCNRQNILSGTTIKVVSVPYSSTDPRGLPASTLVLDEDTGNVKAIVNARNLTALRTAAGSLLSTTLIGAQNPTSIVAFGTGNQAQAHIYLHLSQFSSIRVCSVVYRSQTQRLQKFKASLEARFPSVQFTYLQAPGTPYFPNYENDELAQEVKRVVGEASIIVCATPSMEPLFPSEWVTAGTHVILVGSFRPEMREVDRELVMRAVSSRKGGTLLVDSRSACKLEAGEIIDAGLRDEDMLEIGQLVSTAHPTLLPQRLSNTMLEKKHISEPSNDEETGMSKFQGPITMFKSVGLGVQDVAIACAVVSKAEEIGNIGTKVLGYDS